MGLRSFALFGQRPYSIRTRIKTYFLSFTFNTFLSETIFH